jgi:hypothetical protein
MERWCGREPRVERRPKKSAAFKESFNFCIEVVTYDIIASLYSSLTVEDVYSTW